MSIEKANILTFVNQALRENFTGDGLDVEIQMTLDDLSEEDLLVESVEANVAIGDTTIAHPTGFRAEIAITLSTQAGVANDPLVKIKGGQREYRILRDNDAATGIPEAYSSFNGFFFIWRGAASIFTALIEYYKDHPQDVNTIEFDETKFKNVVNSGVTYYTALLRNKRSYIGIWNPVYQNFKQKRIDAAEFQPRFVQ